MIKILAVVNSPLSAKNNSYATIIIYELSTRVPNIYTIIHNFMVVIDNTHWIEKISDPFSNNQHHDNRQTEGDISGTFDKNDSQGYGHPYCSP